MATTADYYGPYDAGSGANATEDQWRKFMGLTIKTGVIATYLNKLAVTGDSSGMQVKLATGGAWINGAYGENTSGVQTLAIGASHATLNRYDLIVARNNYTTNVVEWDVIAGTPGASPSIPTVTIDTTKYEIALAYVYIAATVTTITAGNVTDQRPFIQGNSETFGVKVGTFVAPASTGNNSVTGVGFKPRLVRFTVVPTSTSGTNSLSNQGVMDSSGNQWTVANASRHGVSESDTSAPDTTKCLKATSQSAGAVYTVDLAASYVSMDADGFTVNFSTASSSYTVLWEAIQ